MTEFDKVIPPGGVGHVKAAIHTANLKGPVTKSVTVTTNDPAHATFSLQIKAIIMVPLDVLPNENVAFSGKPETFAPQEMTVTSTNGEAFDIVSMAMSDKSFTAKVEAAPETGKAPKTKPGTVASGVNRYKVTITPGKDLPVGRINGNLSLKTTHPKAPEQLIRISGQVAGDVEVIPQYVTLSTGPGGDPAARVQHVAIKKAAGSPLKLMGATADNPGIVATLKTVTEGHEYDLEVKYTGQPSTAPVTSKVTVKTNDPRQPTLEVQVWGRNVSAAPPGAPAHSHSTVVPATPIPKSP